MNPVVFTLIRNSLEVIVEEMTLTMVRTAYSGSIREAMDFSAAICGGDGQMIAQGPCLAVHLGSIPDAMEAVFAKFDGDMALGDVFMLNDPYTGGMHLPDIFLFKPIFGAQGILAFLVLVADHVDVGGSVVGSRGVANAEVYAEGLRIPPVRLMRGGEPVDDIWDLVRQNTRMPHMVLGDLRSCLASFHSAERLLSETVERYGEGDVLAYFEDSLAYSEAALRRVIRDLPDGSYTFTDWLDDGVTTPDPLRIQLRLEVRGDMLHFDFDGTSPQVPSAINSTFSFTKSAVYAAVRTLLPSDVPNNAGIFRPIHVQAPAGTVVHAREPAAVAQRGVTGSRAVSATLGALAQVVADRVPAADEGGISSVRITGHGPDGRRYVVWDSVVGTWGARPTKDGVDGCSNFAMNVANASVEILEADYPILIREYGLRSDSGGAGTYRGGLGLVRQWELLDGEAEFILRADRTRFPPWGLNGGLPGEGSCTVLNPDTDARTLPSKAQIRIRKGDRVLHHQASGGGYGDPRQRDPELVWRDWRNDKVSLEQARSVYGVVIVDGVLDRNATEIERKRPPETQTNEGRHDHGLQSQVCSN